LYIKSQVLNILRRFIEAQTSNKCFYAKEKRKNQEASKSKLIKHFY